MNAPTKRTILPAVFVTVLYLMLWIPNRVWAQQPRENPDRTLIVALDASVLSRSFSGQNWRVLVPFLRNVASLRRDEFENRSDFEARRRIVYNAEVLPGVRSDDPFLFAFRPVPRPRFDADRGVFVLPPASILLQNHALSPEIDFCDLRASCPSIDPNQEAFRVPVQRAREIAEHIWIAIRGRIYWDASLVEGQSSMTPRLNVGPVDLIAYHYPSGEILHQLTFSNGNAARANSEWRPVRSITPSVLASPPQETLERLRAQIATNAAPSRPASPTPGAPSAGGAPTGIASLTAGEVRGVADRISECWSVDAPGSNLDSVIVEVRVETDVGGNVRVVRPAGNAPAGGAARVVYEAARRALLDPRCSPLPFPREKLSAINASVFRFTARGLAR